jgi:hypothetical protein
MNHMPPHRIKQRTKERPSWVKKDVEEECCWMFRQFCARWIFWL